MQIIAKFDYILLPQIKYDFFLPAQGFRTEGEIPGRHSSNSRILRKVLTVEIYSHTVNIEKISICLNRGRKESVGNDDVSIVCARKYEMVRMM